MDLPPALRAAIDAVTGRVPLAELKVAGEAMSARYRAETRDGRLHLSSEAAAKAYVAARMPATYAAIRESFAQVEALLPDFLPTSLLDVGAGPGTVLWAAADAWPICEAVMLEASDPIRRLGEVLAEGAFGVRPRFIAGDAARTLADAAPADLVTLAYVLDELAPEALGPLTDRLWALTRQLMVVVEPGTPAGWRRILTVRERLIAAGAHLVAPCPHAQACPVHAPDWCHFARRLPRSRAHRLIKGGEAPFEDEKFIYLAASRTPGPVPEARILTMPQAATGRVSLKLCRSDGCLEQRILSKRDGAAYKQARRAMWGDALSRLAPIR